MSSPKDFHMDAVYPEPLSRLRRGMPNSDIPTSASYRRAVKKQMHRSSSGRFRTQPVTFHEIKEVDEENLTEVETETSGGSIGAASKSESDLKAKFELFYRSISTNNESQLPQQQRRNQAVDQSGDELSEGSGLLSTPSSSVTLTEDTNLLGHSPILKDNSPSATTPPLVIPFNQKSRPSL